MSRYLVSVYHNLQSRLGPYTDGDWLAAVLAYRPDPTGHTDPQTAADSAFRTFNTDVDALDLPRSTAAGGETALAAQVYRLMSLRSLSVGDVVAADAGTDGVTWWACEPAGWRPITTPSRVDGTPLHVEAVRPYLRGQLAAELDDHGGDPDEVHRLCVFDLGLDCGHIATVALNGWYPVSTACCDRLGGIMLRGDYIPFASAVDYVNLLSERYERRPPRARQEPSLLLRRRPRTDNPSMPAYHGHEPSSGRFPARVGAPQYIGCVSPTTGWLAGS